MKHCEQFDGKVAVVTGAGSGNGAATAHLLAERGASAVFLCDIDGVTPERLRAATTQNGFRGYATADELADNIAYLASDSAANVVGAVLLSNGGRFTV